MFSEELIITSVFIAGLLSFFAPCTFPLIPVYIGIMTENTENYAKFKLGILNINLGTIVNTLAFVFGLSTSFVVLGFGAGILGDLLYSPYITTVGGVFIVILGFHQLEVFKLPKLFNIGSIEFKSNKVGIVKNFLMGLAFSLGWTPCVGPILGAVLVTAASSGQALYGGFMMIVYALGLAIPFLIMAIASGSLIRHLSKLNKHLGTIKKIGGLIIVIMGLALMTNQLASISAYIERLFS